MVKIPGKGYRAGTAYVAVTPVFGDSQKIISREMQRMINSMSDEEIEKKIADRVAKGIEKGHKRGEQAAKKSIDEIGDHAEKGAKDTTKVIESEAKKREKAHRGVADVYRREMSKAVKAHGAELDAIENRIKNKYGKGTFRGRNGLAEPFRDASRAFKELNEELNKGARGDEKLLGRRYKDLTDSIARMQKVARNRGDLQSLKTMAETVDEYRNVIEGRLSPAESKKLVAEQRAHDQRMDAARRSAMAAEEENLRRRRAMERKDRQERQRERQRERDANLQSIADAADASSRARVGSMRNLGQEKAGDNARQRRLIESQDRALQRLQNRISATMVDLSKLGSKRTRVALATKEAEADLYALNRRLDAFSKLDIDKQVDVSINDADLAKEVARTRKYVESIPDVELDVDLHDAEAQAKLNSLRAELERVRDLEIGADLSVADLNEIRARLSRLTSEVRNIDIDVADEEAIVAIRRLEIALDTIKDKKVGIDIRETDARAQIAEIEAMLAVLDRKEVDIPINLDVRKSMLDRLQQFNGEVRRGDNYMRSLNTSIKNASISLTETTQAFRIFSPIMAAVVFGGAPLVSLLGNVAAGAGALTSLLPGLAGGFSTLGFAFGGLGDAMKSYEDAQEALEVKADKRTKAQEKHIQAWKDESDAIGEATVSFIEYTDELKTELSSLQMLSREGLFPGVESGLRRIIDEYADPFGDFLFKMGQGFGTFADHWSRLITSPSAQEWFGRVGRDADVYSGHLLIASENFAAGLAHVVDAFRPAMRSLMTWIVDASEGFERWSDSLTVNQTWLDFMSSVRNTMPMINELTGNVLELFIKLTIAVEPFTEAVLGALNAGLDFLNAMDPTMLSALLGVVGGLTGGLMILSGVMAGVGAAAAIIKAAAGSMLTGVATALAGFVVSSSAALGASVALTGEVGPLMESFLNLGETLYIVRDASSHMMSLLGDLFDAISPLLPAVLDLAESAMTLGAAFVDNLAGGAGVAIDILGGAVDLFTMMPEWGQQAALGILVLAASFGKIKSGIEVALEHGGAFLKWGEELIGGFKDSGGALLNFADAIGMTVVKGLDAAGITDDLGGKLALMGENAAAAGGSARTLAGTLVGLGAAAAGIAVLTVAVSALASAQKKAKEEGEAAAESLQAAAEGMQHSTAGLREELERFFAADGWWESTSVGDLDQQMRQLAGTFEHSNRIISEGTKKNLAEFDEMLAGMVKGGSVASAISAWGEFADVARASGVPIEEMTNEYFPGLTESLSNINKELGGPNGVVSQQELMAALAEGRLPDALMTAMESSGKYGDEMAALAGETSAAEKATRDLIAATDELSGRYLSQEEANLKYQEALSTFNEHLKTAERTMDASTEAGQKNRRAFMDMAEATKAKADADLNATGDADAYADSIWKQRDRLVDLGKEFGFTDEEAAEYANTLLEIPKDVNTKAKLQDYASDKARGIKTELDKLKDKTVTVRFKSNTDDWTNPLLNPDYGKAGSGPGPWKPQARGGILDFYAEGGLRPMDPIAQMVAPNTWRVVGDRMDVPEAYVPLDGSPRSKKILFQALMQMPGMFMHDGGIVNFAAGAVAAPAVDGEKAAEGGEMGKVSEAFLALSAALRDGFSSLFADLQAQAQAFFASILGEMETFEASAITSALEFQALTLANETAHREASLTGERTMLASLTNQHASHRSHEAAAQRDFLANMLSMGQAHAQNETSMARATAATLEGILRSHHGTQVSESHRMHNDLFSEIREFGVKADTEWSRIWRGLVSSAKTIFGELPAGVGAILVSTSGKLNKHIIDPFNKIVSDMDLNKKLKLERFPTQSHATGGHIALRDGGMMPGYTPGRDVHRFFSDTGGVLELSGGEPVLRPEAGAVLGPQWVDGVNMAARTGGIGGVKKFLGMGQQAYKDGGIMSFANGGTIPRTSAGLVQLGRLLQSMGVRVSEHPAFGGVGKHANGSWHYRAGALDLNTAPGTSAGEIAYFDKLMPLLHKLGWGTIWRYPNHLNHAHVDLGNRSLGSFNRNPQLTGDIWDMIKSMRVAGGGAGGGGMDFFDLEGSMKGWMGDAKRALSTDGILGELTSGIGDQVFPALAEAKATEFFESASFGDLPQGGGVERWRSTVMQALKIAGLPVTGPFINAWLRQIQSESGGRPGVKQGIRDVNSGGNEAVGLVQVIPGTFAAFRDKSLPNDRTHPLANLVAGMNWAKYKYGYNHLNVIGHGHGYKDGTSGIDLADLLAGGPNPSVNSIKPLLRDRGGALPRGLSLVQNSRSHEETIVPHTPAEVEAMFDRANAGASIDNSTNFPNAHFHTDPVETAAEIERIKRVVAIQRPIKF